MGGTTKWTVLLKAFAWIYMHWGVCFSKLWLSEVAPTASFLEFCFQLPVELIWFSPIFCKGFIRVMKLTCRGII